MRACFQICVAAQAARRARRARRRAKWWGLHTTAAGRPAARAHRSLEILTVLWACPTAEGLKGTKATARAQASSSPGIEEPLTTAPAARARPAQQGAAGADCGDGETGAAAGRGTSPRSSAAAAPGCPCGQGRQSPSDRVKGRAERGGRQEFDRSEAAVASVSHH